MVIKSKIVYIISLFVVIVAVLCACNSKTENPIAIAPNTDLEETYITTEIEYTAGKIDNSMKSAEGANAKSYDVAYFDAQGNGVKLERYKDNKLIYYSVCAGLDEEGNCVLEEYYNAKDKLIATFNSGFFFDADGTQITEDQMDILLDEYK